jgi:hypothetical protein
VLRPARKAKFVFKHRYLIVTRRENMTESEGKNLQTMLDMFSQGPA